MKRFYSESMRTYGGANRTEGVGGNIDPNDARCKKEPNPDCPICKGTGFNQVVKAKQLGLEKTPEEHIEKLVVGFRELRRILRDDGVVFLNYGDAYAGNNQGRGTKNLSAKQASNMGTKWMVGKKIIRMPIGLKERDLIGLAWRLALALQADGWILRSDIIWAKALSFCDKYSGSTMPESVNGWRWEKHKVKVKAGTIPRWGTDETEIEKRDALHLSDGKHHAQWRDCSGCAKCLPNDGMVLRKGSWRPTRAHEYLFLLAKSPNYYCDIEAVKEETIYPDDNRGAREKQYTEDEQYISRINPNTAKTYSGRNLRDVFCINPQAYPDAHYATFPEALVEPCIKVGTSEKGCCPKCGAQWARIVEYRINKTRPPEKGSLVKDEYMKNRQRGKNSLRDGFREGGNTTLGWRPTCKCGEEPVPCIVYDPFCGSGTVLAVAAKLGRNYLGSDLNEDYINNQAKYRVAEGETGISKDEQRAGQLALEFKK